MAEPRAVLSGLGLGRQQLWWPQRLSRFEQAEGLVHIVHHAADLLHIFGQFRRGHTFSGKRPPKMVPGRGVGR